MSFAHSHRYIAHTDYLETYPYYPFSTVITGATLGNCSAGHTPVSLGGGKFAYCGITGGYSNTAAKFCSSGYILSAESEMAKGDTHTHIVKVLSPLSGATSCLCNRASVPPFSGSCGGANAHTYYANVQAFLDWEIVEVESGPAHYDDNSHYHEVMMRSLTTVGGVVSVVNCTLGHANCSCDTFPVSDGHGHSFYGSGAPIADASFAEATAIESDRFYLIQVQSGGADTVGETTATLNGYVTNVGDLQSDMDEFGEEHGTISVYFEYGLGALDYVDGDGVECQYPDGTTDWTYHVGDGTWGSGAEYEYGEYLFEIASLYSGVPYHMRFVGFAGDDTYYGSPQTFTTEGDPPIVTLPATDLNWFKKSATLNGESSAMVTQVYFEFDINEYMPIKSVIIPATASFSVYMHNVYQDRLYYFRAVGVTSSGTKFYGEVLTFELIQDTAADAYVTKLIIRGQPLVPLETMTLTAKDDASIATYGRRTYSLNTQYTLNQDDTQVILNEILAANKDPRINNLIVTFQSLKPGVFKDSVIAADISTRITLINTILGIDGDFFINNVKHTITEAGLSYAVQWRLERVYETTPAP